MQPGTTAIAATRGLSVLAGGKWVGGQIQMSKDKTFARKEYSAADLMVFRKRLAATSPAVPFSTS